MSKFEKTALALQTTCQRTHPQSPLPRPLVRDVSHFFRPLDELPVNSWLESIIDKSFVQRFLAGQLSFEECRRIGFREETSRSELIRRTLLEVAGTVLTCQLAAHYGIAANVAGGTHHASPQGGAGYTIINDLAVATHVLVHQLVDLPQSYNRVLVIDCDVHQGDGTAQFPIEQLFTLSLHCASNYPHPKQVQSTYDVGLPDGMQDDEYLDCLQTSVARALNEVQPDFCIYNAGVDIYSGDRLGRLDVSEAGIRRRDRYVLDECASRGVPVAAVIGGGYDKDADALGRRHAIVHEECAFVWRKYRMWE
jgi:acetoin utilization deacetylase AcuC-like enzyme